METLSDETLLNRYFAGDAQAFLEFYNRHAGRVVGYALSKGVSREIADEIGQEAFLRLHNSIHHYEQGRPALPWFFTIVHNCLVDAIRKDQRLAKIKTGVSVADLHRAAQAAPENDYDIDSALSLLSSEQRQVVELRVLRGQSFKEISLSVEKNESALRKIFERARAKLKHFLQTGEKP